MTGAQDTVPLLKHTQSINEAVIFIVREPTVLADVLAESFFADGIQIAMQSRLTEERSLVPLVPLYGIPLLMMTTVHHAWMPVDLRKALP